MIVQSCSALTLSASSSTDRLSRSADTTFAFTISFTRSWFRFAQFTFDVMLFSKHKNKYYEQSFLFLRKFLKYG